MKKSFASILIVVAVAAGFCGGTATVFAQADAGLVSKVLDTAKLTPEQLGLAKQVGNLASAYVVQKNFAALDGSQGDVANIVSSLRSGKIKSALPSLKNVAESAKLSDTQKQLITTIADKYAPG